MPAFGGRPSGRSGKFRFDADSPEGKEERRKDDAARKKRLRERAARLAEPPPLPSALPGLAGAEPPPVDGVGAGAGAAPGALPVETPAVPWTPELVKEFSDEIISALEDHRQTKLSARAKEGGLPEKIVAKIHADSKYPAGSKRGLQMAAPKVCARLMNKTGVSSEHADTLVLIGSMVMIWKQGRALKADIQEMIDEHYRQRAAAATATAKPATPI